MKRSYFLLCIITLMSCQDKVICPAFQSTYILNDSTRNAYFSYVWQLDEATRAQYLAQEQTSATDPVDSLGSTASTAQPKDYYAFAGEKVVPWRVPSRTKYGIVKPVFMPVKKYRMRTAPMENVLGPETPVSTNYVAESLTDSIGTDSLSLAAADSLAAAVALEQKKEPKFLYGYDPADIFNVEQEYYNKYFSAQLIDNRPEPQPQEMVADTLSSDSLQSKKPFFKGLFKKKNKEAASDSLSMQTDPLVDPTEEEEGNE